MVDKSRFHLTTRITGALAFIGGVGIVGVSVFADSLGVSGGGEGFGWKQLIGAIFGGVIALLGVGAFFRGGHDQG